MTQAPQKKSVVDAAPASSGKRPKRKRAPVKIRPPLMPLIDVMFTLLMFFLIAARPLVAEGMIPANLPDIGRNAGGPAVLKEKVVVAVVPMGNDDTGAGLMIEGSNQPLANAEELCVYLKQVKEQYGEDFQSIQIIIKPTSGVVRWEHVLNAFNQAARAGFKKVGFAPAA